MANPEGVGYVPDEYRPSEESKSDSPRGGWVLRLPRGVRNAVMGVGLAASTLGGIGGRPAAAEESAPKEGLPADLIGAFEANREQNRDNEIRISANTDEASARAETLWEIIKNDEMNSAEAGRKGRSAILTLGRESNFYNVSAVETSREQGFKNFRVPNALFYATHLGIKGYAEFRANLSETDREKFPELASADQVKEYARQHGLNENNLLSHMIITECVEADIASGSAENPTDLRLKQVSAENGEGPEDNYTYWEDMKADIELGDERAPLDSASLEEMRKADPNKDGTVRVVRISKPAEAGKLVESKAISRVFVIVNWEGLKSDQEKEEAASIIKSLSAKDIFVQIIRPEEKNDEVDAFISQALSSQDGKTQAWLTPDGKTFEGPKVG
ncbi:MAG: hypothetical protein AAB360_00610 [Patescibacteria group bacterium]